MVFGGIQALEQHRACRSPAPTHVYTPQHVYTTFRQHAWLPAPPAQKQAGTRPRLLQTPSSAMSGGSMSGGSPLAKHQRSMNAPTVNLLDTSEPRVVITRTTLIRGFIRQAF